ncbi:DNA/RNA nuclease SfsA [Clostridium sp. KNHs216]|uniref:DNA/RNA nuclease SfsA n=1 Tax=Clostridium sp. KNHs216 TaxID=1550235 RepID=UPI001150B6BB|nr:DNA/RNA nuclease SfsA [Clostridium sp. KNHs216]TQI67886.1 DNA-binding sugar fermentation-stimulating protein [Clostridium sp. KNHs216]
MTFASKLYTEGTFIEEIKNRFLCTVNVAGENVLCYIPSSCRLSNFMELSGRKVLLMPVSKPSARTKYSVFAVRIKRNYMILNTSFPNELVEKSLSRRMFSFLGSRHNTVREKIVDGYKSDLYIPETNTVVEVKSVISLTNTTTFPNVQSERIIKQLQKIKLLLLDGYNVAFLLIALSPLVTCVMLNSAEPYGALFRDCIEHGMQIHGYSTCSKRGEFIIKSEIAIKTE